MKGIIHMRRKLQCIGLAAAMAASALATGCAVTSGRQGPLAYTDDRAVTARVKTALMGDPIVTGTQIDVTTFNNVVQLSGFVESQREKERAGEVARLVDGVRDVHNNLVVEGQGSAAP